MNPLAMLLIGAAVSVIIAALSAIACLLGYVGWFFPAFFVVVAIVSLIVFIWIVDQGAP